MEDDALTQSASKKRNSLGRGLSALLTPSLQEPTVSDTIVVQIPLETLAPRLSQPRQHFDESALEELAGSIRNQGVLQPILVRPALGGGYEIIAGERRWRAAKIAGLATIPAIVRSTDDKEALEIALIENLQRQDLSPIEEAACYQRLMLDVGYTQEDLAGKLARSRSHVTNYLRLLQLPASVQALVMDKQLSVGHARALVNALDAERLAAKVIERGLSVRQLEKLLQHQETEASAPPPSTEFDAPLHLTAQYLHELFGLPVHVYKRRNGTAQLRISIATQDDLTKLHDKIQ